MKKVSNTIGLLFVALVVMGACFVTFKLSTGSGITGTPFDQDPSVDAVDKVYVAVGEVQAKRNDEQRRIENAALQANLANEVAARKRAADSQAWLTETLNTLGVTAATIMLIGGPVVLLMYAGAGGWYLIGQAQAKRRMIMPNRNGDYPAFYDAKTGKLINLNLMTSPVLFVDAFEHLSEAAQVGIFSALMRTKVARALSQQKVLSTTAHSERTIARKDAMSGELPEHVTAEWKMIEAEAARAASEQPQLTAPRGLMIRDDGSEVQFT